MNGGDADTFGPTYTDLYDYFYRDKDYERECDLLEQLFQTYGGGATRSVLDLGCGTGGHSLVLAQRGYAVVGVDRSAGMLTRARQKAEALGKGGGGNSDSNDDNDKDNNISNDNSVVAGHGRAVFRQEDIRDAEFGDEKFDAALMMFAVLGYQLENADVLSALRTARRALLPGGLFVFDVWYGPAVLGERPSERVKVVSTEAGGQILRAASAELDARRHLCAVRYRVWRLEDGRVPESAEETHRMRYFFPLELELLLETSGFSMLRLGAFPDFAREPDETTWNVTCAARAV